MFPSKDQQERELKRRRSDAADGMASTTMPTLIGAAMIAAAILLSTLIGALANRHEGFEGRGEDSAWLIDRLTGKVYRCQASDKGLAACDVETATGSVEPRKR